MYVIKKAGGLFVADIRLSGGSSYTRYLQHAKVFPTKEATENEKCGNEYAVKLEECFASVRY